MIYNSWEIMNDSVAVKKSDKSTFKYKGSGIPIKSRYFWNADRLKPEEKRHIKLICEGKEFDAYIQLEKVGKRTRIFWYNDLHQIFIRKYPNYINFTDEFPLLEFTKSGSDRYNVSISLGITEENEQDYEVYENITGKKEGKQKVYYSTKYERNSNNRTKAIKIHGLKCVVCEFDFGVVYGELGKGFIEIHHKKPLSTLDKEVIIDPQEDLVPVCANCHRMIHRTRFKTYSIQEIKDMISKNNT